MSDTKKKLRFITYLSPGVPVEVFETVAHYLEDITGLETTLIYESRYLGPPGDKTDPFTADEVDIGFMDSSDFLRLVQKKNKFVDLCEAGPVYEHTKNTGKPVRYSDVIVSASSAAKFKDLHAMRGSTFGYSSERSSTGLLLVIEHLKKNGFDTSFFSDLVETGSHLASIQSVLDGRVEAAAVDSIVLSGYLSKHPEKEADFKVMFSLGPLPVYPMVFNSRLSAELKDKITCALLGISTNPKWGQRLPGLKISDFVPIAMTNYDTEKVLQESKLIIQKSYY